MLRWISALTLIVACTTSVSAQPAGRDMKITVYSDGRACPGGCDAHVVMHGSDNGTANARSPDSTASAPKKCELGRDCLICFDAALSQCIAVKFRGTGPHRGTFDFTPAFFETTCARADLPARLAADCSAKKVSAKALEGRLNCIKNPGAAKCIGMMTAASEAQQADEVEYQKCRSLGEEEYNKMQPSVRQRSLGCLYEKVGTGRNSAGSTWRKLLPAACIDGKYVGRDGLDCCTGLTLIDGPLDLECRRFYVAN